ncbi:MAG TPA: hypothetical protein VJ625_09530 [Propionibacteriaceae bacterium]|nr:hypothetical protein [Propionibacteriaceae bacterium]
MITTTHRRKRTGWRLVGYLARRAIMMEIHGYQSLYRFLFHRPKVPTGAVGFSYYRPVLAIMIVFIAVSAVELVVLDLIVRRWAHIRIPVLILSLWGLIYMLGLLFGMLTRPHAIGPDGIRARNGAEIDVPLPWDIIESVTRRKRTILNKQPKITVDEDGQATLHLRTQNETNIEVVLKGRTEIRLPHGHETIKELTLYTDDPEAFMNEVRHHLGPDRSEPMPTR